MNDKKDILGAIGGNNAGASGNGGGEPDYKALYEQSQKELQTQRVEAGRLKQTSDELSAARKELEALKRAKRTEEAISALPDDLKNEVPDDIKRGAAIIAGKAVDSAIGGAMAGTEERLAKLERGAEEERNRATLARKREFEGKIASTYPDFVKGISEGGDKRDAWKKYMKHNAGSVNTALDTFDFDTLEYHIKNFYREIEVPLPSGNQDGSATPDPRATGGGASTQAVVLQPGKTYTAQEYQRILNDAQTKFQRHVISYKEYAGICDELTKAYKEGRVK